MDAQHNSEGRFDGVHVSVEVPVNGAEGVAKATFRMGTEAIVAVGFVLGVVLSHGDARERLLGAVTALAERAGDRLVMAV